MPIIRSSSICRCGLWFPYECGDGSVLSRGRFVSPAENTSTSTFIRKPEAATAVWRAPDDGHCNARNTLSRICTTKQQILRLIVASSWVFFIWLGNYSLILDRSNRCLSTSKHLYWLWTPFSLLFNWYWDLCLRVKHSGHEADHTPAYSAEDANECSYTSTLPYAFMAYAGIFTCIWNIIFLSICLFPTKKR